MFQINHREPAVTVILRCGHIRFKALIAKLIDRTAHIVAGDCDMPLCALERRLHALDQGICKNAAPPGLLLPAEHRRELCRGYRLWNVLLWNFLLWNDLLWNDLLWNDLLWNDSFRPFSERHFIVSKSSYIPFIYSLIWLF